MYLSEPSGRSICKSTDIETHPMVFPQVSETTRFSISLGFMMCVIIWPYSETVLTSRRRQTLEQHYIRVHCKKQVLDLTWFGADEVPDGRDHGTAGKEVLIASGGRSNGGGFKRRHETECVCDRIGAAERFDSLVLITWRYYFRLRSQHENPPSRLSGPGPRTLGGLL
jgi:hypothetical protein